MGSPVDLMAFLRHVQLRNHDYIAFCVGGNALEAHKKTPRDEPEQFFKTIIQVL